MSTAPTAQSVKPSDLIAGEVRAHLARRGMSLSAFEQHLGVTKLWAIRRVGPSRSVDLTFEDIFLIAKGLDIPPGDLLSVAS